MPEFNTVFVNFDFSPSHVLINDALNGDDVETAKPESEKVLKAQKDIKQSTKAIGGTVVFENGTNLIINVPFDEELIESMADIYAEATGTKANMGVGKTIIESHSSVAAIRGSQRGHIILSSNDIKEDLVANRLFYKQAKKENYDLRVAEIIKLALSELSIITTEEKVYDIFLRLIKENVLDSVDDIRTYFFQPLEELKEGIRTIYKRQATGCLLYAMPAPMAPGQTVINQNPKQKSPHKRHNWWSMEEYNDGVDWRKTDVQYVPGNVTRDSQNMSMGGEPGEAIATT
jgi:hypothetical protein